MKSTSFNKLLSLIFCGWKFITSNYVITIYSLFIIPHVWARWGPRPENRLLASCPIARRQTRKWSFSHVRDHTRIWSLRLAWLYIHSLPKLKLKVLDYNPGIQHSVMALNYWTVWEQVLSHTRNHLSVLTIYALVQVLKFPTFYIPISGITIFRTQFKSDILCFCSENCTFKQSHLLASFMHLKEENILAFHTEVALLECSTHWHSSLYISIQTDNVHPRPNRRAFQLWDKEDTC